MLLYAAEDVLHIVRRRLEGFCAAAGVVLADVDIQVITVAAVAGQLLLPRPHVSAPYDRAIAALTRPQLVEEITVRAPVTTHLVDVR